MSQLKGYRSLFSPR